MNIKQIFDEITAESSTNQKMVILGKYADNELLKRVLYLANSKRIKFYIKQLPTYTRNANQNNSLDFAVSELQHIIDRHVTGGDALNFLRDLLASVDSDNAYIIERIIEKDCKIGMGTSNMNKVIKGLIEDTPYMGAVSFDEKKARKIFENGGVGVSQIKMDGRYCNAIIRGGEVELESRQGEPTIVTGAKFIDELSSLDDCVFNGELTIDNVSRYESNGIIASLIDICGKRDSRTEVENGKKLAAFEEKHGNFETALNSIRYTIWDTITVDEYFDKKSDVPYLNRANKAGILINTKGLSMVSIVDAVMVYTYDEAMSHFQDILATGQEGTILKDIKGTWKDGKPNWQIKMKLEMDVDLRIVGFNYGTGKNEHVISSVNAESADGKLFTRPTGMNESLMQHITENQESLMGTIIEVKCSGLSHDSNGNYALLHPVFKQLRDDKDTCDSLESIMAIENMAKGLN
jgi:hypothetical protein